MTAVAAVAALAGPAAAADRVYWGNYDNNTISFANLDGSGSGGQLEGASGYGLQGGVAINGATGLIYWAASYTDRYGTYRISFARLDGSGGGDLGGGGSRGASFINGVSGPFTFIYGIALDPAAGRIYWTSQGIYAFPISYANLDGTGGGSLNVGGATVNDPYGIAVDHAGGRVYWTNTTGNVISYARLDGSGGGDLNTTGATVSRPVGMAIDAAGGRAYWSNGVANKISWAALDGSGGGDLSTTGATINHPAAVAIDPAAGRIYWTNASGSVVSYARLDGSGGGDIATTGATASNPMFLALLKGPRATHAPKVFRGKRRGSRLWCSRGSWLSDLAASFLAQAPQTFSYRWTRNRRRVAGAKSRTYRARKPGKYRCAVTARNAAGSRKLTSRAYVIRAR